MSVSNRIPHPFIVIGLIAVLTACTSNSTPVASQTSLPVIDTPKAPSATPINTATPTATTVPPTPIPSPTSKPSLEDILLTDARHVQGGHGVRFRYMLAVDIA